MKSPKGGESIYDIFSRYILRIYHYWWIQYLMAPLLLTVPPVLLTKYVDNEKFHTYIKNNFPYTAEFLDEYYLFSIVLAAFYTFFILAIAKSILKRANANGLDIDGLLILIKTLDGIVGQKDKRFGDYYKRRKEFTKDNLFCEITQPENQISEIVRGIWQLFEAEKSKSTHNLIRVVLAEIKNEKIIDTSLYFPSDEPVIVSLEVLNNENSTLLTAYRLKKLIVIPNIQEELSKTESKSKYIAAGTDDDFGSLICYPIVHNPTKTIPFIISIHCDEKNYFKKEFSDIYRHSLQRFALRLSLEYSLLLIKEDYCGKDQ